MPRIGKYRYPTMGLLKTINEVDKAATALRQGIRVEGLREALGMKKGGAFRDKVSNMKMFGLIEGRGTLTMRDLADRILYGLSDDEKRNARREAWLNIDSIRMVHETFKGKVPEREEEYLAIIGEKSGERDRASLPTKAKQLLSLYREALSDISIEVMPREVEIPPTAAAEMPSGFRVEAPPTRFIEIKAKDYYQRLPYTVEGIDLGITFLNLLKKQMKEKEVEEE